MVAKPSPLPEPDRTTLPGAPLELVVFQVRFDARPPLSPNQALKVKSLLGNEYDHLEPLANTALNIQMTQDGPQASEVQSSGWRFVSRDKRWAVTIFSDQASIECTGYSGWDSFELRAQGLIKVVSSSLKPQLVQRLGLRYMDRIMRPRSKVPADWAGYLAPATLGFAVSGALARSVESVRTEQSLQLSDCQATIRTSCAPDNKGPSWHSMVVDTDCYEDRAFAFDDKELYEKLEILHRAALQLFQAIALPPLRTEWKAE